MSDGFSLPAKPPQTQGLPQNPGVLTFDRFETLNTKPARAGIGDQEMYWCNNLFPIGPNNLRALWDVGQSIYTTASGNPIDTFAFSNLSSTPLAVVFTQNGAIQQVNTITMAVTQIASGGTITNLNDHIGVSQWGSQYVLFVANQTNGYFVWDGASLYRSGTVGPTVIISNNGAGYTSAPAISPVGGTGTAAAFSASLTANVVSTISVTASGTGYSSGDVVYLAFAGGSAKSSAVATATLNSAGGVALISMSNGGGGYAPSSIRVSLQGGNGIGAAAIAVVSGMGGAVSSVTVTSAGAGYLTAPTVVFEDVNNPVAQATAQTMPFGIKGTAIETFANRVWITDGPLITFSAPSSVSDFNPVNGAGAFRSTDSFLKERFTFLRQSNGFLYLGADSSVNVVSGVQVSGVPPITTFSNQNVDPQIGTIWPDTVQVFSRAIVFANSFGVHAMYGGAVQKVSPQLDGIYATVPESAFPITPSGAIAVIYGIHVYMILLPIIDTITGVQRNALCMWDGRKWWTAGPSIPLTMIASQEINSVLTAWGTDGRSLYPLFQNPNNITKTYQSKWRSDPTYFMEKRANRVAGIVTSLGSQNALLDITVDSERTSQTTQILGASGVTWINNLGQVVPWTNNVGAIVTWIGNSTGYFVRPIDVNGNLMGMTVNSTTPDFIIGSLAIMKQDFDLRI